MYNSQYYTCEQIDQRLLQGYVDDFNSHTNQSLTKAQFLAKLAEVFSPTFLSDYFTKSEINNILDVILTNGFIYGGVATPNGTPYLGGDDDDNYQSQLFFTATQPGTYTNYGGIVIPNYGFYIILWDTDTWSFYTLFTYANIGYFECDTAASTAAKTVTASGYVLTVGGAIKIKMINANTANNVTLNINSQGAKALYYQGERASATNSWDAEEVVEIYYDGTSYYANNVNGGSGSGVYDVSKEHPTSGPNSDGKFTLEYILNPSNVNELIPVNKRYPGMFIQFVSTSDNKYVQYRLMATSWSINVSDWQGVDKEIVAGSHNLVESGAVAKKLNCIAYFANYDKPTWGKDSSGNITVTFPNNPFRIYSVDGVNVTTDIAAYSNQTFTIAVFKQLVWDYSDNTIKVIDISTTGDYIRLFAVHANYVYEGLLLPYYNDEVIRGLDTVSKEVKAEYVAYFASAAVPTITYALGVFTVIFPTAAFRIYNYNGTTIVNREFLDDGDGKSYSVSSLNQLVYDIEEDDIKVISLSSNCSGHHFIRLFAATGGTVSGLLAKYWIDYQVKQVESNIDALLNSKNKIQILLTNRDSLVTEFQESTAKTFFTYSGNISVRFSSANVDLNVTQLAAQLNTTLVTSPNGVANCIEIDNTRSLCFNIETNQFSNEWSTNVSKKHIVVLSSRAGGTLYIHQGLMNCIDLTAHIKNIENLDLIKTTAQIFLDFGNKKSLVIENSSPDVFFTYEGNLRVRGTSANKDLSVSQLATELSKTLVTSTKGVANCIKIDNTYNLCFDISQNKFVILFRNYITENHIVLICNNGGSATYVNPLLVSAYDLQIWEGESYSIEQRYNTDKFNEIKNDIINGSDFKALFFSDIHGSTTHAQRIVNLGNLWRSSIDAIIDGGDDAQSLVGDGTIAPLNTIFGTSTIPVLRAVGNHDAWTSLTPTTWADNQTIYNAIISPMITQLASLSKTIVQPSDVATTYKNYYYYDKGDVRIIVLCSLGLNAEHYWDADQLSWFNDVLTDALPTNSNKTVLCVNHGIIDHNNSVSLENNWDSYLDWAGGGIADWQCINNQALSAVDTFIGNGGKFVAWIGGHTHADVLVKSKNQTYEQLGFATSSASRSSDGARPSDVKYIGYDLLNMIAIDTTRHLFKVYRIGYDTNRALQKHTAFVWDYDSKELVSTY